MSWTRREIIKGGLSVAALAGMGTSNAISAKHPPVSVEHRPSRPFFKERGYYITFMRGPLFTYETWKGILDGVKEDDGTHVILWMGGAFPSRRFPITWKYNAEHENVKHNFAGKLIDYGHSLGLKVMLCLTPYGYDGANQYAIEHPELKALNEWGCYTKASGLDAWGFNLNPYRPESKQFMLDYTREMLDFYPNADGILLESSDYAISYCRDCPETYYQKEFEFIRQISDELWARNPNAIIAVYPHYFNGADVPGMKVKGAKEKFDPRWTLFFTPHSAYLDPDLIGQAKSSFYWDPSPSFGQPALIRAAAQKAKQAGVTGYIPSFEPWSYVYSGPDMGHQYLVGTRAMPFCFGWLKPSETPMHEMLLRLDRLAYREFSRDPDLSMEKFRATLSLELFDGHATAELLDDLFFVEESFTMDRTWDMAPVLSSPDFLKSRIDLGEFGPERLREYRDRLKRIASIAHRYAQAIDRSTRELARTAEWITAQWKESPNGNILDLHLR